MHEAKDISLYLKETLQKIIQHGKRADSIVKDMLQQLRTASDKKEDTNVNTLADEYLRLSYHGLKAKDKTFNATYTTDFDPAVGEVYLMPEGIGRVLLNLYNNAFFAASKNIIEKSNGIHSGERQSEVTKASAFQSLVKPGETLVPRHEPTVHVSTGRNGNEIWISVTDNGHGIPQSIIDKIFQPFFTTKPSGQGTGLTLA